MQNLDMITFHCPSCSMMLQVPTQMAGVTGPCPGCSANITAPFPNAAPNVAAASVANPSSHPNLSSSPSPNTIPSPPMPQPAQQAQREEGQNQSPAIPNPLNRQTTATPQEKPSSAKPSALSRERLRQPSHQPKDKPRAQWMRVIFPLTFLIVAALLVLVVLETVGIFNILPFNNKQDELISTAPPLASIEMNKSAMPITPTSPSSSGIGAPETAPQEPTISPPEDNTSTPSHQVNPGTTPSTPLINANIHTKGEFPELQLPEATSTGSHPPPLATSSSVTAVTIPITPEDQSPPKAGFLANQVLSKFLAAKTLEERVPLMSKSMRTREELMSGSLAVPLKKTKFIRLLEMVPRAEDNLTQYLYSVSFEDETEDNQQHNIVMQLVERPGTHTPLVHADAFIDHYEKKFTTYSKQPNKGVVTFHCIAEARTANLAKNLPVGLKDSMIRLIIKSHPLADPAFDAYLNKNSPLMKDIGPRKDFPYTEARFCVLSFRWNTTDPSRPYIELNDIVRQGWER